jgi:hypothetical protein
LIPTEAGALSSPTRRVLHLWRFVLALEEKRFDEGRTDEQKQ